jgi:alkylation response protein AidB-like acyl-CoA dehydrogenase
MDFDLSEEQRLLKDSVDGLLNDSYDFESRKKYGKEKGGWSRNVWNKLAEQGLLGCRSPRTMAASAPARSRP